MMAPRAFDFCSGCFALRQSSQARNMWFVSKLFDQNLAELEWGADGEPSIFYRIDQGTWGMPGRSPAFYLFNARTEAANPDMRRCLWQRDDALMWDMCADQIACKHIDCHLMGYEAEDAADGFLLRRSGSNGTNYGTYVRAPMFGSGDGGLVLMNASRSEAEHLAAVCVPCPGHSMGASGMALCAIIVLTAVLPTLAYMCHKAYYSRVPLAAAPSSWPRRERSVVSYVSFQLGWALTVFGLGPLVLWSAGGWWTGDVASYYTFLPFGFFMMLLAVRPDDNVTLIRSVSALLVALFVASSVIFSADAILWVSVTGSEAWQPSLRRDGILKIFTAVSVCLGTLGFSIAQLPIHGCCPRTTATSKPVRPPLSNQARLRQLWASIRVALIYVFFIGVVSTAISLSMPGRPFSSEDGSYISLAISVLVVYALTSPYFRLRLHMGRWNLIQTPTASLRMDSMKTRTSQISSHTTPSSWEAPWAATWNGDVSNWETDETSGISLGELLGRGTYGNVVRKQAPPSPWAVSLNSAPHKANALHMR